MDDDYTNDNLKTKLNSFVCSPYLNDNEIDSAKIKKAKKQLKENLLKAIEIIEEYDNTNEINQTAANAASSEVNSEREQKIKSRCAQSEIKGGSKENEEEVHVDDVEDKHIDKGKLWNDSSELKELLRNIRISSEQLEKLLRRESDKQEISGETKNKKIKTLTPTAESDFFKQIERYSSGYIEHHREHALQHVNSEENKQNVLQKLRKSDSPQSNLSGILKILAQQIGEDSPAATKAKQDLQDLLNEYPGEVPDAIIQVLMSKLKSNGLGVIFLAQTMSAVTALLISLIPIPGVGVVGDMVVGAADAFVLGYTSVIGTKSIGAFLNDGWVSFKEELLPVIKEVSQMMGATVSGVFCCNKGQQAEASANLTKFGDVIIKLIELSNKPDTSELKQYVQKLNNLVKEKKSLDMEALNNLIRSNEKKQEGEVKAEGKKLTGGGWSKKYKNSINCKYPKGFSQKQFCKAKKKKTKKKRNRKNKKKKQTRRN